jgi:hypothetical protein
LWASSVNVKKLTKVPKQSPNRRKFAQSGHPGCFPPKMLNGAKKVGKVVKQGGQIGQIFATWAFFNFFFLEYLHK